MQRIYTGEEYAETLVYIYNNFDTFYGYGAFGAPADYYHNRERYKVPSAPEGSFLFDCSGFAYKAVPWGWNGETNRAYGGAIYKMKGYEDLETNDILSICDDVSEDFEDIQTGEVVYMSGHVGIYIGKGEVIECTSAWENGVLISCCDNIQVRSDMKYHRTWLKHGKLPFVKYESKADNVPEPETDLEEAERDMLEEVDFGISNLEAAKNNFGEAQECLTAAMDQIERAIKCFEDLDKCIEEFFGGLKK